MGQIILKKNNPQKEFLYVKCKSEFQQYNPSMSTLESIKSQNKQKQNQNDSFSSESFQDLNNSSFGQLQDPNPNVLNKSIIDISVQANQTIQLAQQQTQTQEQETLMVKQLKKTIQQYDRKILQYQKILKEKQIQNCIQKQQKIKVHHQNNIVNLKMMEISKENKQLFQESKEYIEKISCLKQSIQFQRDSYEEKIKTYKGLLELASGFFISKIEPQKIKKLLQTKNDKIRMLVRNIDEISLKTIETKQGRMPSVKLDLDEQIEKLHKINEYCCKLENQKTALKQYILKLQNTLEQKSKDNKGIMEKFLQPIGLFYKKEPSQSRMEENKK